MDYKLTTKIEIAKNISEQRHDASTQLFHQ